MSELREVTTTCLDIPKSEIDKAFGHLSEKRIYEWASYQTALSAAYIKTGNGTSSTPEGTFAKRAMLDKLKGAFIKRGNPTDWDIYKDLFVQHLEDPGTLENFRYFCVPNSDEMIMFYVSIWLGDMASAMEYLHRWGKDLKGNYRKSPEDEAWYRMTEYEGIAVNERLKAQAVADLIDAELKNYQVNKVCFFGGGNLPERLYDHCLWGMPEIYVFEIEATTSPEDLNLGPSAEESTYYFENGLPIFIRESLNQAPTHSELLSQMHIVIMHGVSMYLGKDQQSMVEALLSGYKLLRSGGVMSFDYLLMTDGIKRTATAQHWPRAQEMKIFESVTDAIKEGKEVVRLTNGCVNDKYFTIENIAVNSVEPWGETSVRFVLRKR